MHRSNQGFSKVRMDAGHQSHGGSSAHIICGQRVTAGTAANTSTGLLMEAVTRKTVDSVIRMEVRDFFFLRSVVGLGPYAQSSNNVEARSTRKGRASSW
jgi:hypothetical protein